AQVLAIYTASTAGKCTDGFQPAIPPTNGTVAAFSLKPALLPNGAVQLTTTNWPGAVFRVLGSTNLVNWQTISTVTNVTGTVQFMDTGATNYRVRFYRMVSP